MTILNFKRTPLNFFFKTEVLVYNNYNNCFAYTYLLLEI